MCRGYRKGEAISLHATPPYFVGAASQSDLCATPSGVPPLGQSRRFAAKSGRGFAITYAAIESRPCPGVLAPTGTPRESQAMEAVM